MAKTLIFTRLLEIISNRASGMEDAKDSRHFQMSKAICADMQGWDRPSGTSLEARRA